MKLQLLHGPATSISRKKLSEIKAKFDQNNVIVYEEGADMETVLTNLQSQSLLDNERLVILENPPDFDLSLITYHLSLVLWFDHEVDPKKWVGFEISFFPESREVSVFPLLDFLAEGNMKAFLEIEKLKKASFDIFYIITMVYYLLRNLAVTPANAKDFQRKKLEKQRRRFELSKIKNLYKDILEIEFKLKSGLLELPQAEFLLVFNFLEH